MADSRDAIVVSLHDKMHFLVEGSDRAVAPLDASPEHGGQGKGFRPLDLLLASLGGCTGMDVISILRKKRQDVTSYRIEVSGVQADQHPRVFTEISIRHIVGGNSISEEAVRRAIELSETKYCPAYAMLREAVPISSSFTIEEAVSD